ncbi:hypothetical protein JQ582_39310 [Bradyrhizobium japonicum]|uniref:hypothetical protein n=1 Tax=Bradyrhizobium japonicum TaxID=375 RepID=UPI001BA7BF55|nr:hypothetical protein [Bradyrhizobium japonicum]MBR0749976.1 hypothetical protein [Bradyrhizobium japonicum]
MIEFRRAAARARAYMSSGFARDVGEILLRPRQDLRLYVKSLVDDGSVPVRTAPDAEAVAIEAARILAAVASRQIKPASVVRVSGRICAMLHQCDVGPEPAAGTPATEASSGRNDRGRTFEAELGAALRANYEASERATGLLPATNVSVTWNDGGRAIYGTIDAFRRVQAVYSSIPLVGADAFGGRFDFVQTDAVGGSCFSALAVLGYAEAIRDAARKD